MKQAIGFVVHQDGSHTVILQPAGSVIVYIVARVGVLLLMCIGLWLVTQ